MGVERYRVTGDWCEHLCQIDCLATSEEAAIYKYEKAFSEGQRRGLTIKVTKNPYGFSNGKKVYIGGYKYY